jgi:hypothetical protein
MTEAWRRPPTVIHVETTGSGPMLAGEELGVQWVIGGTVKEQAEDAERLAKGLLCPNCLDVFPAKPGLDTVGRFREVYQDQPDPWRSVALARVAVGCCPTCACSVDDAMHELFHQGVEEPLPAEGR